MHLSAVQKVKNASEIVYVIEEELFFIICKMRASIIFKGLWKSYQPNQTALSQNTDI